MEIETYKQLDNILAQETNVKVISHDFGMVADGVPLTLDYLVESDSYYFTMRGARKPASDEMATSLLRRVYQK